MRYAYYIVPIPYYHRFCKINKKEEKQFLVDNPNAIKINKTKFEKLVAFGIEMYKQLNQLDKK